MQYIILKFEQLCDNVLANVSLEMQDKQSSIPTKCMDGLKRAGVYYEDNVIKCLRVEVMNRNVASER